MEERMIMPGHSLASKCVFNSSEHGISSLQTDGRKRKAWPCSKVHWPDSTIHASSLPGLGVLRNQAIHIDSHRTRHVVCSCPLSEPPLCACPNTTVMYGFSPPHTYRHTISMMAARSQSATPGASHRVVLLLKFSTSRVNLQLYVQRKVLVSADPVKA